MSGYGFLKTGCTTLVAVALAVSAAGAGEEAHHAPAVEHKTPASAPAKHISHVPAKPPTISEADRARLTRGVVVMSTEPQTNGHRWVKGAILIKAAPHVVWETVHEERKSDPDLAYSKVLEEGKDSCTLEQKFVLLPVVGTSVCVMKNEEVPLHRIDYRLLKSDRFKAMEGCWQLTSTDDGHTILELASYIDLGLPVPRNMVEAVTSKKIERRLKNVRKMAEGTSPKIAQKNEGASAKTDHSGNSGQTEGHSGIR